MQMLHNLNYRLYEKSLTLLRNNAVLPLLNSSAIERMASLVINDTLENTFQQTLSLFTCTEFCHVKRCISLPPWTVLPQFFQGLQK